MKKFLFAFTQYGVGRDVNDVCYVGVMEDGSVYMNKSRETFTEVTGIYNWDRAEMQMCGHKKDKDKEVWKMKYYDKCYVINYSDKYLAYLYAEDNTGMVIDAMDMIAYPLGVTFVEDSDLTWYEYEEDPEEKYWRDLATYMERDRDGDEGYSYPEY